MTNTLRIVLIICLVIYFYAVFRMLKKGWLTLKYTLLWLFMGVCMIVLVLFPNVLRWMCTMIGIVGTMNGLFTVAIGFILLLAMALTSIVSKQSERIKSLVQDNAMLEKRIRELERIMQ